MTPRILVLGAGINGLSSAVCIQQACPLAQVQVVAEHFSPDTTSDVSAGFWEPYLLGGDNAELALRVSEVTYRYMLDLARSPLAGVVRAQKISGYHLYSGLPPVIPPWAKFVEGFKQLNDEDLKQYPAAETATFYTSVSLDVPRYLDWLMKRFKSQGGIVCQKRVQNIEEIANDCDILVNCSATSSRFLFKDDQLYPTRGQVWKVHAPWIKHFYFFHVKDKSISYILPGVDYVTVGGTAQVDDWETQPNSQDGAMIWEAALLHCPELTHATPLKAVAGLRPCRPSIRLEPETLAIQGRPLKIVHNYGQGGSGITMHWGCAQEVAAMVLEILGTDQEQIRRLVSRL